MSHVCSIVMLGLQDRYKDFASTMSELRGKFSPRGIRRDDAACSILETWKFRSPAGGMVRLKDPGTSRFLFVLLQVFLSPDINTGMCKSVTRVARCPGSKDEGFLKKRCTGWTKRFSSQRAAAQSLPIIWSSTEPQSSDIQLTRGLKMNLEDVFCLIER